MFACRSCGAVVAAPRPVCRICGRKDVNLEKVEDLEKSPLEGAVVRNHTVPGRDGKPITMPWWVDPAFEEVE